MKKLYLVLLSGVLSSLNYAQDTLLLPSVAYLHIDNDLNRILETKELNEADFSAENGQFSSYSGKVFFRPSYAEERCWLTKGNTVYGLKVEDLPPPAFYFTEYMGKDTLTQEQVFMGMRLVPVWFDFPEVSFVRMSGIRWALCDEKQKELFSAEHDANYVKTDMLYKKAAWLLLKEVRVGLPDGSVMVLSPAKTFRVVAK